MDNKVEEILKDQIMRSYELYTDLSPSMVFERKKTIKNHIKKERNREIKDKLKAQQDIED